MGKVSRSPKGYQDKHKNSQLKCQGLEPTENKGDDRTPKFDYQAAPPSSVKAEKSGLDKFVELVEKWGGIFTLVTTLIGFIFWGSSLQYDVDKAKTDINKNTNDIESSKDKIIITEKNQISLEKDIQYIKDSQSQVKQNLTKLEEAVDTIKYTQAPNTIRRNR